MIRGLWTHNGVLYKVDDTKLYSIDSNGLMNPRATLNSLGGVVDFESNLTQLCINDGSYLYVFDPVTNVMTVTPGYSGGDRIAFLNQRIVFLYRGTQKYGWTALGNASLIDALDFNSAESNPDTLVAVLAFQSELVLFGESSTEIHAPSGTDSVFEKTSAAIDYGCVAAHSAQKSANSAFWLSRDGRGQAMVLSLQGHQAKRISDRAIEERFEGLELGSARAYTYSDGGQSFYCLNVPGVDTTLVWDETYGQWHERAEWHGEWSQLRSKCHAFAYGKHFFGGSTNLYVSDPKVNKFGGSVKRRQRIAPVISSPTMNRVFYPSLEVLCQSGTGANIVLRYSDDNGANWSNQRTTSVGSIGNFKGRARFNRLGSAYDRVFDISMSDDAPFNPVSVNIPL